MDLAVASGAAAAKAVLKAREKGDYSASTLAIYERMLRESFVLKDLETFRRVPDLLENKRFFTVYPELACELMESLYSVNPTPRRKLLNIARGKLKGKASLAEVLLDMLGVVRAL